MTLEEAIAQLNAQLRGTHTGPLEKTAPTGEDWQIVVTGGGMENDLAPYPILSIDEEQAIGLWVQAVLEYAREHMEDAPGAKLYWRGTPELRQFQTTIATLPVQLQRDVETRFVVYAKLVISDAPLA